MCAVPSEQKELPFLPEGTNTIAYRRSQNRKRTILRFFPFRFGPNWIRVASEKGGENHGDLPFIYANH